MIQSIDIVDSATFVGGPHQLFGLRAINYFFGANGSGKTTISRGIATGTSPKCTIKWAGDTPLVRLVYNRDFVEANFAQTEKLNGIFTLGKDEINLASQIEEQREECDRIRDSITKVTKNRDGDPFDPSVEGQVQRQEKLDREFKDACWEIKRKHEKHKEALRGCLRKENFHKRALEEVTNNKCMSVDEKTLAERVAVVFGPEQDAIAEMPRPVFKSLLDLEGAAILAKMVVGKKDVDTAALINKLANSDWVKKGFAFLEKSPDACPFCQQRISASLKQSLDDYFDEAFDADMEAIRILKTNYASATDALKQQLDAIERSESQHLDMTGFKRAKKVVELLLKGNSEKLQIKELEPSRLLSLDGIKEASDALLTSVDNANVAIKKHNKMIEDREAERENVESEVWRVMLDGGITALHVGHKTKTASIEKAKKGLTEQIKAKRAELLKADEVLTEMEKKTTSVEPTVTAINKLLGRFGFKGFFVTMTDDKQSYKLIRRNGELAKNTLSEGEKSFVTFLYFYHLIRGSKDSTNVSASRIVVFDDPVSSLDSDILHIVGSLIRELFAEVCAGDGLIKQLFILTHNMAFYKEVSYFKTRQKGVSPTKVTFWRVQKYDEQSRVQYSRTNPIKSIYDALWADVRSKGYNSRNLPNTLRRILEYAARQFGGFEIHDIEKTFSGDELTACRALMAWANDGSHSIHDDIFISDGGGASEIFLRVFGIIFERCGWKKHYDAMMELCDDEGVEAVEAEGAAAK
jgi:wobble nucleotide-excising tRNase